MRNKLLLITLALSLLPAATASAADFKGTLDAQTPKFTFESSGSGTPYLVGAETAQCAGFPVGTDCDSVLLNVGAAAELQITLDSTEGVEGPTVPVLDGPVASFQDVDGLLFKSNAAGEQLGETLTNGDAAKGEPDCVTSLPSEQCKVPVTPGFYLLVVEYYAAEAAPLKGTLELLGVTAAPSAPVAGPPPPPSGGPPPPPSGGPQPQPQPQPQPGGQQSAGRVAPQLAYTVKPGRDKRPPFAFKTRGRLTPPSGVSRSDACQGRVSIQVKRGKQTVSNRRVAVRPNCTFQQTVKFKNRKRLGKARSLRWIVTFQGNRVLLPQKTKARTVRIR